MSQNYLDLVDDLQKQLAVFQEAIRSQSEPAPAIAKDWIIMHNQIQKNFQSNILNTALGLTSELTPQNLSLQVEIDKQLKMLSVDLAMLQTSRSLETWQKRYQQASDRLILLERYCQMHHTHFSSKD